MQLQISLRLLISYQMIRARGFSCCVGIILKGFLVVFVGTLILHKNCLQCLLVSLCSITFSFFYCRDFFWEGLLLLFAVCNGQQCLSLSRLRKNVKILLLLFRYHSIRNRSHCWRSRSWWIWGKPSPRRNLWIHFKSTRFLPIEIPGTHNFGILYSFLLFFLASYKSTTGGYQSVEVVYESTPEQQLSYQESTYQAPTSEETTYQDTPPQPIYQQSTEYSEEPTSSESYYAKIRESQSNNEDNELIQEIEALEQKLDVLQEEIQNYLNE